MAQIEVLPIRAVLYTPENKRSAFVYMKGTDIIRDRTKEYQGAWVADGYTIDKKKTCTEVWIFADDDEFGIDKRVFENNPMQGTWGYKKHVELRRASRDDQKIPPSDMVFFPPQASKCRIPPDQQEYIHRGIWIKPTYKRDFSQLGSNKAGFLTVSGDMRIAKGEKHSVTGKWNMMGLNDEIVRGRTKENNGDPGGNGKYQIYVRTIKGVRFPINSIPSNKISQIKQKIHQKKGFPIQDQMLSFNDVPLKDEKTVATQGICNGDTIDLNPITIYVRDHKGKKFTFTKIDPDELVKDIKDMIEKREGTPADEQRLYFKKWKLGNDCNNKPISHFKIRHQSVLDLVRDETPKANGRKQPKTPEVIVKTPDGKSIPVPIKPEDTIKDIKKEIAPDIGLPPKDFKLRPPDDSTPLKNIDKPKPGDVLSVVPNNGNTPKPATKPPKATPAPKPKPKPQLTVRVPEEDGPPRKVPVDFDPGKTLGDLDDDIEKKTGVPKTKNRVFHLDDDGNELPPDTPVRKAGIRPGAVLDMMPTEEEVTVRLPNGRNFVLVVDPINDTPDDIRDKVAKKLGFPAKDIKLVLDDEELDENFKPSREQILDIAPQIEVRDPYNHKKVGLSVLPGMTIGDLDDVIEEKTGVPKAKSRVFFLDDAGNELPPDTPLLKTDIRPGTVLDMKPTEEEITFRPPNGRNFVLVVDPINDTPDNIRRKAAAKMHVPFKDIKLYLDGEELDENFKPSRGQVLDIASQVEVSLPDHKNKVVLSVLPCMTIGDLEDIIEEKTGVPKTENRVFFFDENGNELPSNTPASKTEVYPGAILEMKSTEDDIDDVSLEEARCIRDGGILEPHQVEFVLPNREKIVLSILPGMTLGEVKEMVIEEAALLDSSVREEGRLFFMDDGLGLDDDAPFDKVMLEKGQSIGLSTMQLIVQHWDGSEHTIAADSRWYLQDIQEEIYEKAKVRPAVQRLFFNGSPLQDHKQLGKQGLEHQSTIKLEKMEIRVEVPAAKGKNRMVQLPVEEGDSVKKIKTRAAKKAKVSLDHPCLVLGGVELSNTSSLGDAKVLHDELLKLEEYAVIVVDWDGEIIALENGSIKRTSTVGDLKTKILEERDIPINDQKLLMEGRQLRKDNLTLKKEKIPHRARIVLEPKHINIELPDADKKALKKMRKKKFKSNKEEEIWPVDVDLKRRYFFFDAETDFDANIEVMILHWSGKEFKVDRITPTMKINDLKDRIYKLKGIEKKKQKLKLNGRLLDGKKTLLKAGVHHRARLTLESPKKNTIANPDLDKLSLLKSSLGAKRLVSEISLTVKTWKGESFELAPLATAYIDDIIDEVADVHNITVDAQRLTFQGRPTSETMTLAEQGIVDGSVLEFVEMTIFVEVPTKKKPVEVFVENDHTIGQIKRKLAKKIKKLPIEKQCMMFGGEELNDTKTLLDYSIDHGDSVTLEMFRVRVIQLSGVEFDPEGISRMSTIHDIKAKISRKFGIDPAAQKLLLKGEALNDVLRLCDQGVEHGAILFLEESEGSESTRSTKDSIGFSSFNSAKAVDPVIESSKMCLHIKHWNGDMFIVKVQTDDYPDDVREKIRAKKRIPVEKQRLKCQGQNVDDAACLSEQGICDGTTLELGCLEIHLELPSGKVVTFETTPDESILRLKRQIKEKTNEAIEDQNLMFGSELLENTQKVSAYNLEHGDTVKLEHFAVRVADWHGDMFEVHGIQSSSSVDALKKQIEKLRSLPLEQQILKFNSLPLNDLKLSHQGITHRSVLVLEPPEISFLSPVHTKVKIGSIAGNEDASEYYDDFEGSRSTMASISSPVSTPRKKGKGTKKKKSKAGKVKSPDSASTKEKKGGKKSKLFKNVKKILKR